MLWAFFGNAAADRCESVRPRLNAIASRHRGDGDRVTILRQQRQSAGAQRLDIVGMGMDGEDGGHGG